MILLIDSGNSRLKVGWLDGATREPAAIAFDNLDPHALGDWLGTLARKPVLALGVNVAGAERGEGIRAALAGHGRSEEHTSELQSLMRTSYAVFGLKKKTIHNRKQ